MPLSQRLCRDTSTGIAALGTEMKYTYTQPAAIRQTHWKRLKQLNYMENREEEVKRMISKQNSSRNSSRLKAII